MSQHIIKRKLVKVGLASVALAIITGVATVVSNTGVIAGAGEGVVELIAALSSGGVVSAIASIRI